MKIISIYIVIAFIGIAFLNCSKSTNKESISNPTKTREIDSQSGLIKISKQRFEDEGMELSELDDHSFRSKIASTGIIDVPPNGRSVISAQIGGYIKNSSLLIGDFVEKGQLIVSIENIEFLELQQHYLEVKELLTFLESDYYRQKELYQEKITSEKSFLKAESDYKKNLAIYKSLEKKLELLNIDSEEVESGKLSSVSKIYAPMAGHITQLNITIGSYVSSSDVILEIVSTEHLHLELKIFEKDMLKVKIGQTILFTLPETGEKQYTGKVHLIGKSINSDRTVTLHAHIDESYEVEFIPGMFVQAEIMTEEMLGIGIPKQCIINKSEKHFVMVLVSEKNDFYLFKKIEVDVGMSSGDQILIMAKEKIELEGKYLKGFVESRS